VILLTWVFITVFWIDELCSANAPKKSVFLRHLTVVFAVGGLAAVQLLPFLELLQKSQRGLNFAEEFGWAMPPWGWANLLVPLFRCYRTDLGVFLQYDQKWTSSYYSGAGVFALSLLAAWTIRRRQVWILTMLVFVSLVLALGDAGYLYSWLRKLIPGLGLLRYPIKFVVLTNFLFPLLAASALASADFKGADRDRIGLRLPHESHRVVVLPSSSGRREMAIHSSKRRSPIFLFGFDFNRVIFLWPSKARINTGARWNFRASLDRRRCLDAYSLAKPDRPRGCVPARPGETGASIETGRIPRSNEPSNLFPALAKHRRGPLQ
jgi:hypothetical protein